MFFSRISSLRILTVGLLTVGLIGVGGIAANASPVSGVTQVSSKSTPGHGGLVRPGKPKYVKPNVSGLKKVSTYQAFGAAASTLPESYSLQDYTVPVGDQGTTNACVTWAIGYSMLGWYAKYYGQAQAYAPMYIYSQDVVGNDGGSAVADAYNILESQGIPTQAQYTQGNYNFTTKPTAQETADAAANKITAPHWLYDMGSTNNEPGVSAKTAIETAISQRHPVALSIPLFNEFYNLNAADSVLTAGEIGANETSEGGHEVLIVGYNSTGVIVQNQWGTSWGNKGFATLDWAFVEQYSYDATWIYGFQKNYTGSTVPAAPNQVTVTDASGSNTMRTAQVRWSGTGFFDDAAVHPVTGYHVTMTNLSDGTVQSRDVGTEPYGWVQWLAFNGLSGTTTYTFSIYAVNAIGNSATVSYTFTPANGINFGPVTAADLPSPAMPAGAALTPAPTPTPQATKPGAPSKVSVQISIKRHKVVKVTERWSAPKTTGNRNISTYQVTVTGKAHGRTKYQHTFTYTAGKRSAVYTFTGKNALRHGLYYMFAIQVKNTANLWSSTHVSKTKTL